MCRRPAARKALPGMGGQKGEGAIVKYVCSLIVVDDVGKSRFLYETLLGCRVVSDFGENVGFEGSFAIHQERHFRKLISGRRVEKKSNSCELYFEDDEIEKIEEKIGKHGFEFIHKTKEQPWRQRVFRFYDYDGNIIEIGESLEYVAYRLSLENKTVAEIVESTSLPERAVVEAIRKYSKK